MSSPVYTDAFVSYHHPDSLTNPCSGITVDLSRAFVGSRHDTCMIGASQIQQILWRHAKGHNGRQMMLYGDKGYHPNDVLMTPFEGNEERMPRYQVRFNRAMSRCRIGVEHEFGRTRNLLRSTVYEGIWSLSRALCCQNDENWLTINPCVLFADNLRFYLNELEQMYHVAVFFKNCLVCFGRGPGGAPLAPPSLEEYLRRWCSLGFFSACVYIARCKSCVCDGTKC